MPVPTEFELPQRHERGDGGWIAAGEVIRRHATGVIVGRAPQRSWHRERETGAGEGDTGERVRQRVAPIGEWDRRMIYRRKTVGCAKTN